MKPWSLQTPSPNLRACLPSFLRPLPRPTGRLPVSVLRLHIRPPPAYLLTPSSDGARRRASVLARRPCFFFFTRCCQFFPPPSHQVPLQPCWPLLLYPTRLVFFSSSSIHHFDRPSSLWLTTILLLVKEIALSRPLPDTSVQFLSRVEWRRLVFLDPPEQSKRRDPFFLD